MNQANTTLLEGEPHSLANIEEHFDGTDAAEGSQFVAVLWHPILPCSIIKPVLIERSCDMMLVDIDGLSWCRETGVCLDKDEEDGLAPMTLRLVQPSSALFEQDFVVDTQTELRRRLIELLSLPRLTAERIGNVDASALRICTVMLSRVLGAVANYLGQDDATRILGSRVLREVERDSAWRDFMALLVLAEDAPVEVSDNMIVVGEPSAKVLVTKMNGSVLLTSYSGTFGHYAVLSRRQFEKICDWFDDLDVAHVVPLSSVPEAALDGGVETNGALTDPPTPLFAEWGRLSTDPTQFAAQATDAPLVAVPGPALPATCSTVPADDVSARLADGQTLLALVDTSKEAFAIVAGVDFGRGWVPVRSTEWQEAESAEAAGEEAPDADAAEQPESGTEPSLSADQQLEDAQGPDPDNDDGPSAA